MSNGFYGVVGTAYNHSIISGYSCGGAGEPCDGHERPYFRPGNNATRGQTSKIVANTFLPSCSARARP